MKYINEKSILLSFLFLILASFFLLGYSGILGRDMDYKKDWWAIYFIEPKSDNLDFIIENHNGLDQFHWKIFVEKNLLDEGVASIAKGDKQSIDPDTQNSKSGKFTIEVSSNTVTKKLSKTFSH